MFTPSQQTEIARAWQTAARQMLSMRAELACQSLAATTDLFSMGVASASGCPHRAAAAARAPLAAARPAPGPDDRTTPQAAPAPTS